MTTPLPKFRNLPFLGFGIGLRNPHFDNLIHQNPAVDWLEIISENFMLPGGKLIHVLDQLKERYKIVPHGVSLSIGSSDPLNWDYLKKLKSLVTKLNPPWFSDHLCWGQHAHHNLHNLMPLPYTEEVVTYIAKRIEIIQDYFEKPFLLENLSSYVEFKESTMPEWIFLSEIAKQADCGILLDINNIYVSAFNHHFDPIEYLNGVPSERVIQYHIAGHSDKGTYILDTHDHEIKDEVWALYQKAIPIFGKVSTMIERDDNIPPLSEMLQELETAKTIWNTVHAKA